jgi:bZIP transcription factor
MSKRSQEEMAAAFDEADSSDDEDDAVSNTAKTEDENRYDRLERLKREKRLAMNRECARVRRRRKKMRMELLEGRVQEMATANGRVQEENDLLMARVGALEVELNRAKAQQALQFSAGGAANMPPNDFSGIAGNFLGTPSAAAAIERAEKLRYLEMLQAQQRGNASFLGGRRADPPAANPGDAMTEALLRVATTPAHSLSAAGVKPRFAGRFY